MRQKKRVLSHKEEAIEDPEDVIGIGIGEREGIRLKGQERWREMKMKVDRIVGESRRRRGSHGRGSPVLVRLLFDVSLMWGLVRTVSQGQSWLC